MAFVSLQSMYILTPHTVQCTVCIVKETVSKTKLVRFVYIRCLFMLFTVWSKCNRQQTLQLNRSTCICIRKLVELTVSVSLSLLYGITKLTVITIIGDHKYTQSLNSEFKRSNRIGAMPFKSHSLCTMNNIYVKIGIFFVWTQHWTVFNVCFFFCSVFELKFKKTLRMRIEK